MPVASDPLGIDISAGPDLDPTFRLCRGTENMQNALMRRLSTPAGALEELGDDPEYGYDVPGQLNNDFSGIAGLAGISSQAQAEVNKDPRVQTARGTVVNDPTTGGTLTVGIQGETAAGPFGFVMPVGDVTTDALSQGLRLQIPVDQTGIVGGTVTVINQAGPPGEAGPAGTGGTSGAGVSPDFDGLYATDAGSEVLFKQVLADFSTLTAGSISIAFAATIRALDGATGTFRVRVGGTDNAVDGTVLATITTTSSTFTAVSISATVTNPVGLQKCKLTGQSSSVGKDVQVKSTLCEFGAL